MWIKSACTADLFLQWDFVFPGLEDGKAEKLLLETFRRHSALAVKQAEDKKKRFEEMDRKKKERAESERKKEEEELKMRWGVAKKLLIKLINYENRRERRLSLSNYGPELSRQQLEIGFQQLRMMKSIESKSDHKFEVWWIFFFN